jgi:GT2 family glycosyltransferase
MNHQYVAFLNDDTRVDRNWLFELVKNIEKSDNIFAVGSKILFFNNPKMINHAGASISIIGAGIDEGIFDYDSPKYNKMKYVGAVCGAGMLVNKAIFNQLGGFDADYFAYFEDLDLCWRAWLYGYKVLYIPTSIIYHKFGGTWGDRYSYKRIYLCQKNKIFNVIKNYEKINILKAFSINFFYDIIRVLMFIKEKQYKNILAIYKGTIDTIKKIHIMLDKRSIIKKHRVLKDKDLYKKGLILSLNKSIKEFIRLNLNEYQ